MNIGFHYYLTKVLADKAGFSESEAEIIAYACQYVDDAQEHQIMRIKKMPQPFYERMGIDWFDPTCTSHKGINNILYNFTNIRNKVLIPFHFIPGGWDKEQKRFDHLTVQEAPQALKLVKQALKKLSSSPPDRSTRKPALIRLGIALHSYEDTYAHQGFSGRNNQRDNGVSNSLIRSNNRRRTQPLVGQLTGFLGYKIGHGLLGTFPDRFQTEIFYRNGRDQDVYINTNRRFLDCARRVYDLLRGFTKCPGNWDKILSQVEACLELNKSSNSEWQRLFQSQFPGLQFKYKPGTWKNRTIKRDREGEYTYTGDPTWFYFHQASFKQRKIMIEQLL